MNAQSEFLPSTTRSISPAIERRVSRVVNPESAASADVYALTVHVVRPPARLGFRDVDEIVADREKDARKAAALARARQRLALRLEEHPEMPTVASLRLRAGFSQARLADIVGTSQSSYSLIEAGKRSDVYLSTVEKLAAALGVSLETLVAAMKRSQASSR